MAGILLAVFVAEVATESALVPEIPGLPDVVGCSLVSVGPGSTTGPLITGGKSLCSGFGLSSSSDG